MSRELLGPREVVGDPGLIGRSKPDAGGLVEQRSGERVISELVGGVGAEDVRLDAEQVRRVRRRCEGIVDDACRRLGVALRVEEQPGGIERALQAGERLGLGGIGPFQRLADADDVAARIGQEELADAVRHVAERPDAGDAAARNPSERLLQAGPEVRVQLVDVGDHHVAGAVRIGRLVALEHEELELDRAALDRGEHVRRLVPIRHLEAERLVEGDLIVDRPARQDRDHPIRRELAHERPFIAR